MNTALVTGGSGKIGGTIAEHLRRQGWSVLAPTHAEMWVEYSKHVNHYLAPVVKLDLVVCAHGLYGEVAPLENSETAMWREAIAVNLVGTYNVCRHAIEKMESGMIVNMAGGGGMLNALPLLSSYACSKAGIVSLTKTLAEELKGRIRVNCIFPGMQDSKIHDHLLAAGEKGNPHYASVKGMRETGEGAIPIENTLQILDWLLSGKGCGETGKTFFARSFKEEREYLETA